jgi:hypothetical protein
MGRRIVLIAIVITISAGPGVPGPHITLRGTQSVRRLTRFMMLAQNASPQKIHRLPPEAFPQLPAGVTKVLRRDGCTIPQPFGVSAPANVIRGKFFNKTNTGWAVLCSDGANSKILVFRNDADASPEELAKAEDKNYLQALANDQTGYSRMISATGRRYIMEHYRAYGGPKPPAIDHSGIDDAILDKASVVHYRYAGKWLELTGSD